MYKRQAWSPTAKLVDQVEFHLFSVTGIVCEQKPQFFYTDAVDEVSILVEMIGSRFGLVVFNVSKVFFEAGPTVGSCRCRN